MKKQVRKAKRPVARTPARRTVAAPARPAGDVKFVGEPMKVRTTKPAEVIEWPRTLLHIHTYGLLSPFFQGLTRGKLMATRCTNPKCEEKRFWLPPRADCPDCLQRMEWVTLPNPVIGRVFTFTHVEYPGHGIEISYPYYQIDVEIPGAATIMKGYLVRGEARIGMKVKAGFRTTKPTNTIFDLYWEPVAK